MRPPWWVLALLAPVAAAHGAGEGWPPEHHSPHVLLFLWEPREPARGDDIKVRVATPVEANTTEVVLEACRVQAYACRTPIVMKAVVDLGDARYFEAVLPWDGTFYRPATQVGLSAQLRFANGSEEATPVDHWPARPVDLPPEGGVYYYYALPAAKQAPAPGLAMVGLALAWPALRRTLR